MASGAGPAALNRTSSRVAVGHLTMTDTSQPVAAPSTTGLAGLSPAYFGMVMATGI